MFYNLLIMSQNLFNKTKNSIIFLKHYKKLSLSGSYKEGKTPTQGM